MNTTNQTVALVYSEIVGFYLVDLVINQPIKHVYVVWVALMSAEEKSNFKNILGEFYHRAADALGVMKGYAFWFKSAPSQSFAHFTKTSTGSMLLLRGIPKQYSPVVFFMLPETVSSSDNVFNMVRMSFVNSTDKVVTAMENVFLGLSGM